ncbi:MAG: vWA domain-containing protein [Candidatus Electryoneaceae bacterium]|nr:vWA domain-containing protein [Candidatus Electryoneaceae bacterium]
MYSFHLTADYPLWLIIVGVIVTFGFAIWSYRRTYPPTRRWIRGLLIFLRWSALFGGLLILSQPVIERHKRTSEPATVLFLVDRSASMGLTQGGVDRIEAVENLLNNESFRSLQDRFRVELFDYADSLGKLWDNAQSLLDSIPTGIGTNIGRGWVESFDILLPDEPAGVVIVSDGAHNNGPDPIRLAGTAKTPIWTVGVGSPDPFRDVMVLGVAVNPVLYQGSRTPVDVGFRAVGASGETIQLTVRDAQQNIVDRRRIDITGDYEEGSVSLDIEATIPGRQRFSVDVSALDNELTVGNNRRGFYVNVLAERMKILLMAGPPDNSLGDIVRRLKRDEHVELTIRTTRGRRFYEGDWLDAASLNEMDAVILHHFPIRSNRGTNLTRFADNVMETDLPICFIDGGQVDSRSLQLFDVRLPATVGTGRVRLMTGEVVPIKRHAIIADPDDADFTEGWSGLPPLTFLSNRFTPKPQAMTLAEFQPQASDNRYPAIIVMEQGNDKGAMILGRDLWRWGLVTANDDEERLIEQLLNRLVRWLAVRKTSKRVEISFDKELFSNQESVGFTVTVLDEAYQSVDNADIRAEVSLDGEVGGGASLEGIGQGRYRGSFQPWGDGEYRVNVAASVDDEVVGQDHGRVSVEPFNIELLDARLNEEVLMGIADASGGSYVPIGKADSLFNGFEFAPVEHSEVQRWELWGKGWLLAVIIGLLAVEWFIRVRVGML